MSSTPPTLTPDRETGLGDWSDAEIERAITQGVSRDGRQLAPAMPWPAFATLTGSDRQAIVAYLRSLPPVHNRQPRNAAPGEKPTAPYLAVLGP